MNCCRRVSNRNQLLPTRSTIKFKQQLEERTRCMTQMQ